MLCCTRTVTNTIGVGRLKYGLTYVAKCDQAGQGWNVL